MTQAERRVFLIRALLDEHPAYAGLDIPEEESEQRQLLRSLMNVRPPQPASQAFMDIQDAYLQEETRRKGIVRMDSLHPTRPGLYLWQGDITTLQCDAIVNAANSRLLGCFVPCHTCMDNMIHTYAGVQLRLECARIMAKQQGEEPAGQAKITGAYNLPSRYVLHTVVPVVTSGVTRRETMLLESCYRACLELAAASGIRSLAFCCISAGEFLFPKEPAANIAIRTVDAFQKKNPGQVEVLFHVCTDVDLAIYRRLLHAR